jgi:thiol:disulfide interchange protein DsbC
LKISHVLSALPLCLMLTAAWAESPVQAAIRKAVISRMGDEPKIESITKTPYGGLYEVRAGHTIVYADATGRYMFEGNIFDTKTTREITRERVADISRIKFSDLPLDLAIKQVKGNGKRVLAVFEDPQCGYCKKLRETLLSIDNITLYTYTYNILSDESAAISRNVWCSADPGKAWDEWMLKEQAPAAAPESCKPPMDKIFALGQKLDVQGTPTVFFTDGTRAPGAMPAEMLEARLSPAATK